MNPAWQMGGCQRLEEVGCLTPLYPDPTHELRGRGELVRLHELVAGSQSPSDPPKPRLQELADLADSYGAEVASASAA